MSIADEGIKLYSSSLLTAVEEAGKDTLKATGRKTKKWPNGNDLDFYLAEGPEWVRAYHKWRLNNYTEWGIWHTPDGKPAIEIGFQVDVDGTDAKLRGFIDRVFENRKDGSLMVVDLKTGSSKPVSSMQLAVYAKGIKQTFGVEVTKGAYYSAREGKLQETYDLRQFPEAMIDRWVRHTHRMVTEEDFFPSVTLLCSWCGVKDHCYAWNPAIERPNFTSDIEVTWDDIIEPYDSAGDR